MKNLLKHISTTYILTLFAMVLQAQNTLQVITKKIEHEYPVNKINNLIIRAEKGVVDIRPCENDKVNVVVKIIVKNKDFKVAKKELEYIHCDFYQKNSVIQLANNVVLPNNISLESIVRVEYQIQMPHGTNLTLQNSFGRVKITDMTFSGKIDIQYCDLILKNVNGIIEVTSNIGDLYFSDTRGSLDVVSKYSALQIDNPYGSLNLSSTYGSIKANVLHEFSALNINAERCNVSVSNKNCIELGLNLESRYASIHLNESCYIRQKALYKREINGSPPNEIVADKYLPSVKLPTVRIKSAYGNINLD